MNLEHRQYGLIDIKADGKAGTFSGYGAVFGNIDSYGDVIEKGAFKSDLSRWEKSGKLPKMLLQHGGMGLTSDDMMPVGQWTSMSEDTKGLKVDGRLFALNTERGQYIYEGLKSGELDSLSIGYETIESEPARREGKDIRLLTELKLWEVSIVTFPANDRAQINTVKNLTVDQLRDLEGRLRDEGVSRSDAARAVRTFKQWLQRDAGAPINTPCDEVVSEEMAAAIAAANAITGKLFPPRF